MDLQQQFITERHFLKNVTEKTLLWYQHSFKAFDGALDSKAAINARIAELRQRGVSATSVNTYLRCINAYLRWLREEHGHEPLKIPKLKEEQKILATFQPDQILRIVNRKPVGRNETRIHTMAVTALDTGLRLQELLNLSRQDIDLENLVLRVKGKGNKHRLVPVSIELRRVLYRYLAKQALPKVFGTMRGTVLRNRNADRDFKEMCRKLGFDRAVVRCSFHTLRHSFAVNYLRKGGNLYYLQRILGHSSITTTERYLRSLGIEDLQKVHDGLSLLSRS